MTNAGELWESACGILKQEMTDISYQTWIESSLKPFGLIGDTLILECINAMMREYGINRIMPQIQNAVSTAAGKALTVEALCQEEMDSRVRELEAKYTGNTLAQLNPKYTFDTFVVGSGNRFAHAVSLAVAEVPAKAYNPLFIYGGVGLGKTHLMHAIGHYSHQLYPQMNIVYITSEDFTNQLVSAMQQNRNQEFRDRFRNADILMVDDIQFIAGKQSTQEEFFHTFNSLHDAHKQIVIASDRPAKEIKSLEERLRTRFEWGLTADVQPPDFETRVAIVKRKAELLHLDLPEDVAEFIANHLKNNIRQLEGAVKKLNAYYMLEGIQPVISVAQNAIKDILNETQPVPVTIEKIIGEVSRTFNVSPADIRGTKRNANVASARRVAIYILREVTGMSMEEIGREFSGRDHSTIVYSLKTMERDMKNDQHLRETVSDIIKNVKA